MATVRFNDMEVGASEAGPAVSSSSSSQGLINGNEGTIPHDFHETKNWAAWERVRGVTVERERARLAHEQHVRNNRKKTRQSVANIGNNLLALGEHKGPKGPPPLLETTEVCLWSQVVIEELEITRRTTMRVGDEDEESIVENCVPNVFLKIRSLLGCRDSYLQDIVHPLQEAPPWHNQNRSWMTESGRFILQAITPSEAAFLVSIAEKYCAHLEGTKFSVLDKYVGLYSMGRTLLKGYSHIAVVMNEFPHVGKLRMDYLYSLSGTNPSLFTTRTGAQYQVLSEGNFVEEQQLMMIGASDYVNFYGGLKKDAGFLKDVHSIDYTMILGIRKLIDSEHPDGEAVNKEPTSLGNEPEGFHGWRINEEPVVYHMSITNFLQVTSSTPVAWYERLWAASSPVTAYNEAFMQFLDDRLLSISGSDALKWESSVALSRRKMERRQESHGVNTLAMVAACELEDEEGATYEDILRWRALVDVLEVGSSALGMWRELVPEVVESSLIKLVDVYKADMRRRPLPPYSGPEDRIQKPKGVALTRIDKMLTSVRKVRAIQHLGGNLCSTSSRQYSLALAIAVGVEAATLSSAKISARSHAVFENYRNLRRRPAAVHAKRRFYLPEAGCWLSPPHMLPDLHFVEYAPEIFADIRASMGLKDSDYIDCVCPRDFYFIEFMTNSKSGEFFFFTHDKKCMVKTISMKEARALQLLIKNGYVEHLEDNRGSLLTRIMGLYQVQLPWFNRGTAQCFIVQENLLYSVGPDIAFRFDLKGSTRGRTAKAGDSVKKDNDWVGEGHSFGFSTETQENVRRQHKRDCEFLAACGVIDYSLFVVGCKSSPDKISGLASRVTMLREVPDVKMSVKVLWDRVRTARRSSLMRAADNKALAHLNVHGPHASSDELNFHLGIIDYLIPWNWQKRCEFFWRVIRFEWKGSSVHPPWGYATRQVKFLNLYWGAGEDAFWPQEGDVFTSWPMFIYFSLGLLFVIILVSLIAALQ
mmetsp:Transcript_1529/g.3230  ORF Transcript_1529/g.3230 Transcript_1529/m.3230 type:complete len:984 (+) Transcript_1529:114-3065(+)